MFVEHRLFTSHCDYLSSRGNGVRNGSIMLNDKPADLGWPRSSSRRSRPPAQPKRQDLTAANVKRRARPKEPRRPERPASPADNKQRQQLKPYEQLYQEITQGQRSATQPATRQTLFGGTQSAVATSTAGLRAKLSPTLATTKDWTRVQRKVLPKYLFVLDAFTAVQLLQCLVRLQPPVVRALQAAAAPTDSSPNRQALTSSSVFPADSATVGLQQESQTGQQALPAHQQQPPHAQDGPSLDQLAQLPTSISGAVADGIPGLWPAPPLTPTQLAAADAAAMGRSYLSAADERRDFDLMLAAVLIVLAPKLSQWPFTVLTKTMCCVGQLQLQQENFLEAWFAATQDQLSQQSAANLFSCAEALSRLGAQPPEQWFLAWQHAAAGQLSQLSPTQLGALQLHLLHLGLQPPGTWWQQLHAAVLAKVAAGSPGTKRLQAQGVAVQAGAGGSVLQQQALDTAADVSGGLSSTVAGSAADAMRGDSAAMMGPPDASISASTPSLIVAEVDALCICLCSYHHLPLGVQSQGWLPAALQLCLTASQQGCLSTGAALQLLAACVFGGCKRQPTTAAVQDACLALLQQRMPKLPSPSGVAVLFECLQAGVEQRRVPVGFADALSLRLLGVMQELPTDVLLKVPHVLKAIGWQGPNERLVASFALATQARLQELGRQDMEALIVGCAAVGFAMPSVWHGDVDEAIGLHFGLLLS